MLGVGMGVQQYACLCLPFVRVPARTCVQALLDMCRWLPVLHVVPVAFDQTECWPGNMGQAGAKQHQYMVGDLHRHMWAEGVAVVLMFGPGVCKFW